MHYLLLLEVDYTLVRFHFQTYWGWCLKGSWVAIEVVSEEMVNGKFKLTVEAVRWGVLSADDAQAIGLSTLEKKHLLRPTRVIYLSAEEAPGGTQHREKYLRAVERSPATSAALGYIPFRDASTCSPRMNAYRRT